MAQNNLVYSKGTSLVHKKSDKVNAINEAISDAQINAVVEYGGYINAQRIIQTGNQTRSRLKENGKKYKTSGDFTENNRSLLRNSVSAMVRNIDINSDTVWISKNKFRIIVRGKFEVNMKDIDIQITNYLRETDKKIKIEVKENDCFGQIYKPMSEYINSKKNNFFFSNQAWLIGESDYKIEINTHRAVLYDKSTYPNIIIKIYPYNSCQSLVNKSFEDYTILDEMINDMYAVYIYKSDK